MKKCVWFFVFIAGIFSTPAFADQSYSGALDLVGSGLGGNSILYWNVEYDSIRSLWDYSYLLDTSASGRDISHVILETSQNVPIFITNSTASFEIGDPRWYSTGTSNPNMPDGLFGIKWDVLNDTTLFQWSFSSNRSPMWGDFYWKDGSIQGRVWNAGWNSGFTSDDWDPCVAVYGLHNGSQQCHVLVPDTAVVPVPGAVILGGIGLVVVGGVKKRKAFPFN